MSDVLLIEDLANSPPQEWATLIMRGPTIQRLANARKTKITEIQEEAAHLGISSRTLFRLISQRRRRLAGGSPRRPMTGMSYGLSEEKERVIADAIVNAGTDARLVDVYNEAVRLSEERYISAPSETSIRTRFGKPRPANWRARLGISFDYVVDLCGLDLSVYRVAGERLPAHCFCLLDASNGKMLAHRLFAGTPDPTEMAEIIADCLAARAIDSSNGVGVGFPPALARLAALINRSLPPSTMTCLPMAKAIRPGYVIKAAVGSRVGRVAIKCGTPERLPPAPWEPVPFEIAALVIAHAIESTSQ